MLKFDDIKKKPYVHNTEFFHGRNTEKIQE